MKAQFLKIAYVLLDDFYVDDLLIGGSTYDETLSIRNELIKLCNAKIFLKRLL